MKLGSQTVKSKFSIVHKIRSNPINLIELHLLSYIDMEIQIYILSQLTNLQKKFTNKRIHKVIKLTTKTIFHPFLPIKKNTLHTRYI